VAIRAQQHALSGLGAHLADTPGHTPMAKVKGLCRPITMMELKCRLMLIKSTDPASSTRLFDKLVLDLSAALRYGSDAAFHASEAAIGTLEEGGMAMLRTPQVCIAEAGFPSCISFLATN
jgi:hypothetical protein